MVKQFGQRQKEKKEKTKQLWGKQFNIVDKGLDEKQVVNFVNDLIKQIEASATKIKADEAAKIMAQVNEGAEVVKKAATEKMENEATVAGETELAETKASAQISGVASFPEQLAVVVEEVRKPAALTRPEGGEIKLGVMNPGDATPYTGEVELNIGAPVDLKVVSALYNSLQTIPELRILHTRGSAERGTAIIVVLNKPLPLIDILLSKLPRVELVPELLQKDDSNKPGLLLVKDKKVTRRIKVIPKA